MNRIWILATVGLLSSFNAMTQEHMVYESDHLNIRQVAPNSFVHESYLQTDTYGKVGCNGLVVYNDGEAVIFDTPVDDESSNALINWVQSELGSKIVAVVPTHFHFDCLGGLPVFHEAEIPSFSNKKTAELAEQVGNTLPQNTFDQKMEFELGSQKVVIDFPGEGHTVDNVVGYFSKDQVLFGGCLVKSLNAGKGNLNDANIDAWSGTIRTVKSRFPDATIIVPGHGNSGDQELLDYTIEMFQKDE